MGELSKRIGEQGEAITLNFLKNIGWEDASVAIDLPCLLSEKHKHKGKEGRQTHGIDVLFPYESPFFENILDHIVVSVKFSQNSYPLYPNSDFKSHFKDLSTAMECYDKSELQNEYSDGYDATIPETKGLLVWIHNKDEKESILDKISTARLDDNHDFNSIYVLDNNRLAFLNKSISFIQNKYNNHIFKFHYIDTGSNPSTINKRYDGDILPIQMLFSDIQLYKLEDKVSKQVTLAILLKDKFEEESLKRVFGLSLNISKNFTQIDIYFPDYDVIHNKDYVSKIKRQFKDKSFTKKINVLSYDGRFQNIGE